EALSAAWGSCRTKDEQEAYRHALHETMDLWYGHAGVTVVSVHGNLGPDGEQKLDEEEAEGRHWFGDSGWVAYELRAARVLPRRRREVTWPALQELGRQTAVGAKASTVAIEDGGEPGRASADSDAAATNERRRRISVSSVSSVSSMGSAPRHQRLSRRGSYASTASLSSVGQSDIGWDDNQLLTSPWPVSADAFDELTAEKRFAHAPDRATVQRLYCRLAAATLDAAEVLDFSSMPAPSQSAARGLGQYLRGSSALRELRLERAGLSGRHVDAIVEGLIFEAGAEEASRCPPRILAGLAPTPAAGKPDRPPLLGALEVLNLHHNTRLGEEGLRALRRALEGGAMPALRVLNLNHCSLQKPGGQMLVELFPYLPQLKELILEGNGLGDKCVHDIAEAMSSESLPRLTTLTLGSNRVGNEGARALAKKSYSARFSPLSRLDLHYNEIGDAGAEEIAAAVQAGKLPKIIDLEGNLLESRGIRALEKLGVKVLDQKEPHVSSKEASDRTDRAAARRRQRKQRE
ncbi:unnamed protein product, partial [Prorocentrum cordatum]